MAASCIVLSFALLFLFSRSESSLDYNTAPVTVQEDANELNRWPKIYTYEIVESYPHDPNAFTQGHVDERSLSWNPASRATIPEELRQKQVLKMFRDLLGIDRHPASNPSLLIWLSGLYGESTARRVEVTSGEVIKESKLSRRWFGEGLTRFGDEVFQLTWKTPTVFVYDLDLNRLGKRQTPLSDGWGLTTDGQDLIATDGSSKAYWLDPVTLKLKRNVTVHDDGREVNAVNELEWINGKIWANVWYTECIAIIEPSNGRVSGWVVLKGLKKKTEEKYGEGKTIDVLNGIAYDALKKRVFVTGKLWPRLYHIKTKRVRATAKIVKATRRMCIDKAPTV